MPRRKITIRRVSMKTFLWKLLIYRLREERKRRKWSLDNVADLAGYSNCSISNWERGKHYPMPSALRDWRQALGV